MINIKKKKKGHRQTGSGTQPLVAGNTSWSVKNESAFEGFVCLFVSRVGVGTGACPGSRLT